MGGIGGYTRNPEYSMWERFRQEVISRYVGSKEERWALEEIDKMVYKDRIDTYGGWTKLTADQPRVQNFSYDNNNTAITKTKKKI